MDEAVKNWIESRAERASLVFENRDSKDICILCGLWWLSQVDYKLDKVKQLSGYLKEAGYECYVEDMRAGWEKFCKKGEKK